jgi:imidazoleglycerol-phosphate dehydratase / histidinol-phosphatase
MKKLLILDRDGTLIAEPPDEQIDSLEKLEFLPGVFNALSNISKKASYEMIIVSNQDGLGTDKYPQAAYDLVQDKIIKAFENEGIVFSDVLIDVSMEGAGSPNRKPEIGLLKPYMNGDYDLQQSIVIGDRITDVQLAKNLGAKAILIAPGPPPERLNTSGLADTCILVSNNWELIARQIILNDRLTLVQRDTKETQITVQLNLDGSGQSNIHTGLGFFDHMLDQIAKHGQCDLDIQVSGDLHVDEHHTIEDTGLALGEAFNKAFGDKKGAERYGFVLPMDESLAQVAIDFGGRPWLVWDADFKREKIGDMPTEMFFHFFKSFCDAARCNLNVKVEGDNEHHKIEGIFKAFARSIKLAKKRDIDNFELPTTKGVL